MNQQKKLFSHMRQKENKALKRNWDYFHRWRKNIDPHVFSLLCEGSCLNCKHCVLDSRMHIYCEDMEVIRVSEMSCSLHEPSRKNWLDRGNSLFDMEEYEP